MFLRSRDSLVARALPVFLVAQHLNKARFLPSLPRTFIIGHNTKHIDP